MKFPIGLSYNGHHIPVKRHSPQENEKQGYYNTRYEFISVQDDPDMRESITSEVFMHEIIEMINWRLQLDLPHKTITVLSENLFAVIRNNNLDFCRPK